MSAIVIAALAFVAYLLALPRVDRVIRLAERYLTPVVSAAEPANPDLALPPDIEALAEGESEQWARDAVRERAWELFRAFDGDWDRAKQVLHAERHHSLFGSEPDSMLN